MIAQQDTRLQEIQKKEKDKKSFNDSGIASCSADLSTVEDVGCHSSVEDPDDLSSTEVEDDRSGKPLTLCGVYYCNIIW